MLLDGFVSLALNTQSIKSQQSSSSESLRGQWSIGRLTHGVDAGWIGVLNREFVSNNLPKDLSW